MKKKVKLIIVLVAITLLLPIKASAVTLGEYEAAVEKYTKELQEKEAKIARGKEEIAAVKKTIAETEEKIASTEREVEALQAEIERCDREIKKKDAESKKIMEYYQIENGNNAYLEYVFGATSITDMIYRMSVAEQLTDYNDKVMKELKQLIETNKKKKAELKQKQEELNALKKKLESEKELFQVLRDRLNYIKSVLITIVVEDVVLMISSVLLVMYHQRLLHRLEEMFPLEQLLEKMDSVSQLMVEELVGAMVEDIEEWISLEVVEHQFMQ